MGPSAAPANLVKGGAFLVLAVLMFDTMGAIVKYLSANYPPQQLSLFRNLFGLLPSAAVLFATSAWHAAGRPWRIRQWRLGLARGGFVALAQFCFYAALGHLAFATATTLAFAGPLIITALSVPVLGEKVGVHRWTSVAVGFVGVLIILRPGFGAVDPFHLLTLVGAVMWASYQLMTRLAGRRDSPEVSMFYLGAVGFAVLAVVAPFFWRPPTVTEWGLLLLAGGLGAVGHFLIIKALALAPASTVQPFTFLTFVWAIGLGWLVFDALPDGPTVLGALIIIASGLYVFHREHRQRAEPKEIPAPRDR